MIIRPHKRGDFNPVTGLYFFDNHNGKERWTTKERFEKLKASSAARTKKWASLNPEKRRNGWLKRYTGNSREEYLHKNRLYLRKNATKREAKRLERIKKNPEKYRKRDRDYKRNKYKTNPLFVLSTKIRNRIRCALFRTKGTKSIKTFDAVGCSIEQLKKHIERKFLPGMNWSDSGKIHIDHIVPLSSARSAKEMMALCHYTNLQPLWARDNLVKGAKLI